MQLAEASVTPELGNLPEARGESCLLDYYVDTEYGLYILWVVYSESLRPFQLPFLLIFG